MIESHTPKLHLLTIPREIQQEIYSYLLVNPILGKAASVSAATDFGSSQAYDLHTNILYVCKRTYQEGILTLYGNPIFMDCSKSPGIWELQNGTDQELIYDHEDFENGIEEPNIINLCPLTRYTNNEPKEHVAKPPFRNTPAVQHVKSWNVLLSAIDRTYWSSDPFAEFCVALHPHSGISLELSVLPMGFICQHVNPPDIVTQDQDVGQVNNLLPLKMLRNIKNLVFKTAEVDSIPDYCYGIDNEETDLSVPDLPSPELMEEYYKLTSGEAPVIECVGRMWDKLLQCVSTFERAKLHISDGTCGIHYRGFRFHDVRTPSNLAVNDIPSHPDIPHSLAEDPNYRGARAIADTTVSSSLEHTESTEDVVHFKQYRRQLLETLEPQYQRIRRCATKIREYLQHENGPNGIFVIRPSSVDDRKQYWDRIAKGIDLLEEYEYSFIRSLTEEVQLSIQKQNKFIVLKYKFLNSELLMHSVAWAYKKGIWRAVTEWYKLAVACMEKQFFKLQWCRMDLFMWDVLDNKDVDMIIQPEVYEETVFRKEQISNRKLDLNMIMKRIEDKTTDLDSLMHILMSLEIDIIDGGSDDENRDDEDSDGSDDPVANEGLEGSSENDEASSAGDIGS
ncbi:hypothetical protein SBOR_6449 [Sclerotinia borealis F-4128]|uniref:F-box domain-containing protein n=1 Tax=Sclerotinia borealis (strain F-4128) TaxID=1432307 RepID=W9CF38_SCLBF|nr:hypothetical protein SBOR_6449 [Sclerotinia borealis F-4128]